MHSEGYYVFTMSCCAEPTWTRLHSEQVHHVHVPVRHHMTTCGPVLSSSCLIFVQRPP